MTSGRLWSPSAVRSFTLWCWRYNCYNSPTISIWHHHTCILIHFFYILYFHGTIPFKASVSKTGQWVPSTAINYFISPVQVRDRHVVSKWSGCLYIISMWKVVLSLLLIGKPAAVQTECLDQSSALRTLLKVLFLSALLSHAEMSHNSRFECLSMSHRETTSSRGEAHCSWRVGLLAISPRFWDNCFHIWCRAGRFLPRPLPADTLPLPKKHSFKRIHTVLILFEFKSKQNNPDRILTVVHLPEFWD